MEAFCLVVLVVGVSLYICLDNLHIINTVVRKFLMEGSYSSMGVPPVNEYSSMELYEHFMFVERYRFCLAFYDYKPTAKVIARIFLQKTKLSKTLANT